MLITPVHKPRASSRYQHISQTSDDTNGSSFSFTDRDLSGAGDGPVIVSVLGNGGSAGAIATLTVAGQSPASSIQANNGTNQFGIFLVPLSAGVSTGTIAVGFAASKNRCAIGWGRARNLRSTSIIDSDSTEAGNGDTAISTTIDVEPGGFTLAVVLGNVASGTWTWSEPGKLFDFIVESTTAFSGFSAIDRGKALSRTVTATPSASFVARNILAASFR